MEDFINYFRFNNLFRLDLLKKQSTLVYLIPAILFVIIGNHTMTKTGLYIRIHVVRFFLLFSFYVFSKKITTTMLESFNIENIVKKLKEKIPDIIMLFIFWAIIGGRGLVSHGRVYAQMATDLSCINQHNCPTARRIVMEGLSSMFGFGQKGYVLFWYTILFICFFIANQFLKDKGMHG